MEQLLTPEEAANILQVTDRTIRRYLRDGKLKGVRISNRVQRIPRSALEAFIEEQGGKECK